MEYTIEDLERELSHSSRIVITEMHWRDTQLEIAIECKDWREQRRLRFLIRCVDVLEWRPPPPLLKQWGIDELRVTSDHPLLWEHNSEHGHLHFASAPSNAFELSEMLRDGLQKLYGEYDPPSGYLHATASILSGGSGLIARGPMPVVEELERIAKPHIRCSISAAHRPKIGPHKLFEAGECYAICDSVELVEWTAI